MKKILPFLIVLAIFASCEKELAKKPDRLIEKDKMVDIIYDLTLLGVMRNQNAVLLDSFKNNSNQYIYKKHKIDSIQFAQSNIYYAADFKEYKKMYDQVKLRLDKDKSLAEAVIKAEKKKAVLLEKKNKKLKETKKADSIKRVKIEESKIKKKLRKKEQADSIKKAKSKAEKIRMKRETDSLKKIVAEEKKRRVQIKN